MSAEYRPQEEYFDLTGGFSSEELFNELQDSAPPADLSPLPLNPALADRLRYPVIDEREVPVLRRAITQDLLRIVADPANGLDADSETVYDLRQGLSEGMQNTFRNNAGIWQIDLQRTCVGGLYAAIHNIAVDYPAGPVLHERPGQRPLRLDGARRAPERLGLADDEHGWGLGLIGRFAMNGSFNSMGFYDNEIVRIPVATTDRTEPITRLVFWSLYAKSGTESTGFAEAA